MTARAKFQRLEVTAALALAAGLLACAGCYDSNSTDHKPPDGEGAIVVLNNTFTKVDVFVNGTEKGGVNSGNNRAFDMTSGVYRVALTELDGNRSYAGDVDVLVSQDTVLDVTADPFNTSKYDVAITFKSP